MCNLANEISHQVVQCIVPSLISSFCFADITNPSKLSPSVSDTDHLHLAAAAGSRCEHFPPTC